jgi:nitrate ABC transporter ATP-binding subunit
MIKQKIWLRAASTYLELALEILVEIALIVLNWRFGECDCLKAIRPILWTLTVINAGVITYTLINLVKGQTIHVTRKEIAFEVGVEAGLLLVDLNFLLNQCPCAVLVRWFFIGLTLLNAVLIWLTIQDIRNMKAMKNSSVTHAPTSRAYTASVSTSDFLVIEGASKVYPTPKGEYVVLQDVNLTVREGEFVCLIGHSGCGKSTLLNMVGGFSKPTDGLVTLHGKRIVEPGPDRMMVFQGYALLPWLTAHENIYLAVDSVYPQKREAEKNQIVQEHLAMVGLTEAAHKQPGQLSGGMRQRVAIARALAIRPEVLILDEPFGALDAITKEELQIELLKIWNDHRCTVLMITHDIDEALFLADRLVMMTNGPAAKIGEILEIPFPRPRDRDRIMEDPEFYKLRNYILDYLYNRFAHDDE